MKKILLILIIILFYCKSGFSQHCYGQNLIPNPSLDSFSICPDNVWQIDRAIPWTQPLLYQSASTVINQCMFDGNPTQLDTAGCRKLNWRSQGMALNILWADDNWRVYLEVPLNHRLESGQCYYGEFWVLTQNVSYKVIDALGMYFSDTLVKFKSDTIIFGDTIGMVKPIYALPQISNPLGRIIKDTVNWEKISGTFIASGTETAMIVGNFTPSNLINWEILNNNLLQSTRYMFDDFLLCKCEDTISPINPENELFIPNIFTPNGDGQNEVFRVRGENIEKLTLLVYNRWGNKVFEGNDPQAAWDGTYNKQPCAEGVYYYVADVTFTDGRTESRKGSVTLLR